MAMHFTLVFTRRFCQCWCFCIRESISTNFTKVWQSVEDSCFLEQYFQANVCFLGLQKRGLCCIYTKINFTQSYCELVRNQHTEPSCAFFCQSEPRQDAAISRLLKQPNHLLASGLNIVMVWEIEQLHAAQYISYILLFLTFRLHILYYIYACWWNSLVKVKTLFCQGLYLTKYSSSNDWLHKVAHLMTKIWSGRKEH